MLAFIGPMSEGKTKYRNLKKSTHVQKAYEVRSEKIKIKKRKLVR